MLSQPRSESRASGIIFAVHSVGDHVELYPTIPSERYSGSIESGSVGIVREVESDASAEAIYLVEFFGTDRGEPGEEVWLQEQDLFPTRAPLGPLRHE
jgi:hypothetical protein